LLINISFTFDVTSAGRKQFVLWVQNSVTWPRPRPLRVILWSGRSRGTCSMSVPNLKRISLFVQTL